MYYWFYHSTHNEFAAKSYSSSAADYQIKPVDATKLNNFSSTPEEKLKHPGNFHVETLVHNTKIPQKIPLPYKEGYEFIEASRITYCQANGAYTKVFLDNRKYILVSKTLKDIEDQLPPDLFQRIHHSTVINLGFISHFVRSDGGYVKLQTGEQLPVSKTKKDRLMERLGLK